MKLKFALFCDAAATTANGKFILHGLFDHVNVEKAPTPEEPVVHPSMSFAFQVEDLQAPEGGTIKVEIIHEPSGKSVFLHDGKFGPIVQPNKKLASIVQLNVFPLIGLGNYVAKIVVNGHELGGSYFEVLPVEAKK